MRSRRPPPLRRFVAHISQVRRRKFAARSAQAELVAAAPDDFVVGPSPVCIGEYQRVPDVLQAIKGDLNRRHRPGRFVLTGSARFDSLPRATQTLTGRIPFLDILPFSQGEISGDHEDFLDIAIHEPELLLRQHRSTTTRAEYAERVCRGGLPLAIELTERGRRRWFDSYLSQSLSGDNYTQLLCDVFLLRRLPAWGRTLHARAGKTPKLHLAGLRLLRELLGERFRAGFVLTTGEYAGRLEDRIYTCPIDRLWQTNRRATDSELG